MKKIIVLLIICMGLFTGCENNTPAKSIPASANENTPTVDAIQSSEEVANANHPDASVPDPSGDVVVIREKMFIAQTNDIYFNAESYLGKTIQYEGIFDIYEVPESKESLYSVIRYGPGCCGIDANAGFEIVWTGEYPNQNDWVEAVGILEEYEDDGNKYLRLALTDLTVLPTRGAEYVNQ